MAAMANPNRNQCGWCVAASDLVMVIDLRKNSDDVFYLYLAIKPVNYHLAGAWR